MALTQVNQSGIADDSVDIAQIKAGSDGQLISYDASGNPVKIAAGTSGHFLKSQGNASQPVFAAIPASGISDIVSDTTPQLGGNLDVQTSSITTSTTNGNVTITPNGSGSVHLNGDVTFPGSATNQLCYWDKSDQALEFWDQNGGYAKASFGASGDFDIYHDGTDNQLKSANGKVVITTTAGNSDIEITPNGTGDVIIDGLKYPQADGSANQYLKTDGSGALSWATVSTSDATKVPLAGGAMTGQLSIDTSATASTICQTLKAPQNDRLALWENNDGGDGSWYATGGSASAIDLQWNSYSAQVIKFENAGDVEIITGNLKIGTSGKGIDFSATGDATGMTNELLDDYEEGTWTPDFEELTVDAGNSYAGYVKIGNLCQITCSLLSDGAGTSSSAVKITGLPFSRVSYHEIYFSPMLGKVDTDEGGYGPVCHGYSYGADKLIFERNNRLETGSNDYIKATHCGDNATFQFTYVFRTA